MKDPGRLIDASTRPELVRLLRAGRDEAPSEEARRRTLRAVSLGAAVTAAGLGASVNQAVAGTSAASLSASAPPATTALASSVVTTTSGATSTGLAATGVVTTSIGGVATKVAVATGLAKWAGLGALTAASVIAPQVVEQVRRQPDSVTVQVAKADGPSLPSANSTVTSIAPTRGPTLDEQRVPGVSTVSSAPPSVEQSASSSDVGALKYEGLTQPPPASDFAQQMEAVERARRAIGRSDAALGLYLLEDYERRYPQGQLLPEVFLLKLDALQQLGRVDDAREVARRILRRESAGSHAQRARAVLDRSVPSAAE
jgi:hypothetical protein